MNRHLTDEVAQSLVEELLPEEVRARCQAHVAGCVACRALVASYRALGDALDGLEVSPPPPDFTDAVMARIEAHEDARAWERRLAFGIAAVAGALAVALLGAAGASALAPMVSRASGNLGGLVTLLSVGSSVVSPIVRALRLEITLGCAALGLPLLYALSRLAPWRAEATG
jgi:hypothetical protein